MRPAATLVAALAIAGGCGRVGFGLLTADGPSDGTPSMTGDGGPADAIVCTTPQIATETDEGTMHQDAGLPITWVANPPSSGTHYPDWVIWNRTYDTTPIARGYWVHNVEHGGVVFLYHCDPACPAEVARLTAMLQSYPQDPDCPALGHRGIIVEDPLMPPGVRFD